VVLEDWEEHDAERDLEQEDDGAEGGDDTTRRCRH
jgi:hypothetical protein